MYAERSLRFVIRTNSDIQGFDAYIVSEKKTKLQKVRLFARTWSLQMSDQVEIGKELGQSILIVFLVVDFVFLR